MRLKPATCAMARIVSSTIGRHLNVLAGLVLMSCTSTVKVDEEVVDHGYRGTPKRLLVFGSLDSGFSDAAASAFPGALNEVMARCGVQSEVFAPNHLQLNPDDTLRNMVASFRPDTLLLIRQSVRESIDGAVHSGTYVLTLKDLATRRDIWTAVMRLYGPSPLVSDRSKGAASFAEKIMGQLAGDKVLKGCPSITSATETG